MPAPTGLTNGEQHLHEAEEAASADSDTAASPADSLQDAQQESTASRVSSYLNNLPETAGQHALPHQHVPLLPQMVAMEGPSTSPGPPHHPPPPPEGSHVVLLHIVDGESIQFHRGDSVELIRGPATVQMVSSSASPPMAYPVQVPPGHMMQQVVDGNGTLRHVILSPEPSAMPAEPAALSVCHRTPSSAAPAGFYPSAAAPADYMVEPLRHKLLDTSAGKLSAAPPPPAAAEQQHLPHHLQQQRPSARYSTLAGMETGYHPPPSAAAQLNYSSCSGMDERQQRRAERLRRKLMERQRNQQLHPATSLQLSAGVARNGVGGADATDSDRAALSSCSPLSSGSPIEDDADSHTTSADQRQLTPPNVTEVTSCSALIVWHPSRTTPPSNGCADACDHQLGSCQLLLAEQKLSATGPPPPPASAYKPQQLREELPGPVTSCMLDSLHPATTYWIVLQLTAGDGSTCRSDAVRFTTLCAPPEPPLPPTLHSRTKTSLHLRWSAPHDNGSRIRQYVLECDAGAGFFEMYRGKSKQHSICHLQPGTVYRCRVAALNELGSGRPSALVALSTCGHVPPAPAPPQLLASRATALQLSWRRRDTDSVGFALQMEQEGSQYGFRAVYSGAETHFTADKLLPNTGYAFKLRAMNEEGASAWSDVVRVRTGCRPPQPPTKLQLRGRTHAHQLRVQWEPPADTGGGQLVAYVLEQLVGPRGAAGDGWEERYSGSDRDFTLTNLAPGTSHRLRVLCEGEGGRSAPSATLQVATDPVAPGLCLIPRLLGRPRANSCQTAWSRPDFPGGESPTLVTGYQLRLTPAAEQEGDDDEAETAGGGEEAVVYEGPQLEASVTGLLPGSAYLLQVRAISSVGAGPWSGQLEFCSGAAAPDQPSAPRLASTVAAASLYLCWCPPVDHGAVVVDYRLEVSCGVSGQFQSRYHGPAVEYELRGLAPSTAYSVRVSAANAAGWSVPSEPLLAITAAASPAAVAQLAIEPTATEMLVSWSAPVDHGAPITGYSVETTEQGAPSSSAVVCHTSGPLTRVTVASLQPETVYRVRVQATNSVGSGPFSAVCKSTTLCQPPPPPALAVTHTAHNWVRLRWTDPTAAPRTAHLLEYTLECEAKNGEFYTVYGGTGTQYKATRLTEDSEYRFRICAANSAGDGPYSDVVSTRTTTQLPPAVRGVRVTDRRETWVRVEWTAVRSPTSPQVAGSGTAASSTTPAAAAVRYQVELAPINSSQFVKVHYGTENSCRLSKLEPGRDYQLRVCCCLVAPSITAERRSEGLTPSTAVARGPCTTPLRFSTTATLSPAGATPIHVPSITVGANGMRAASNSTTNRQQTGGAVKTAARVWTEKEWAGVILLGFGLVALLLAVVVHQVITVFTTK